jgi:hypothetical protein
MKTFTQTTAEAAVLTALRSLNETLDELAGDGWIARLYPRGHLYEAHLVTDKGVVVLRPDLDPPYLKRGGEPAAQFSSGTFGRPILADREGRMTNRTRNLLRRPGINALRAANCPSVSIAVRNRPRRRDGRTRFSGGAAPHQGQGSPPSA